MPKRFCNSPALYAAAMLLLVAALITVIVLAWRYSLPLPE